MVIGCRPRHRICIQARTLAAKRACIGAKGETILVCDPASRGLDHERAATGDVLGLAAGTAGEVAAVELDPAV